jgi:serine/threonine protein kinase
MARIGLNCPGCFALIEVEDILADSPVRCRRCGQEFTILQAGARDEPAAWTIGKVILADFVVERVLGRGGMGRVYLVRSRSTGRQFAVKTIVEEALGSARLRNGFLEELHTWIDLPEHPNLTACHFFRTVEDRLAIFTDYVEGGSLADWIRNRRLTGLDMILDMAIQFAWGLHAAHEFGVVHQDVKPANVLVTLEGQAKVSDFGLARARAVVAESTGQETGNREILVTFAGATLAYCSPEQANQQRVSRKADIWSWGASVLEMITGGVTWHSGPLAPQVLDQLLDGDGTDSSQGALDAGLGEVLRKCFEVDPDRRWSSLAEAADALRRVYRESIGSEYPRSTPPVLDPTDRISAMHDRRIGGMQWIDPMHWLTFAWKAAGRDLAQIERSRPTRSGSRKAQAIADLTVYEEARTILARLVAHGRHAYESKLADLCIHEGFIYQSLNDLPGSVAACDLAIAMYERLVEREDDHKFAVGQAWAYMGKASALRSLGDPQSAMEWDDRAIATFERLVEGEGRRELADQLAKAYMNMGVTQNTRGDARGAIKVYDRAVVLLERLVEVEGRRELSEHLAKACLNKAIALREVQAHLIAAATDDRAIAILEQLVEVEGRHELVDVLARASVSKALSLLSLRDKPGALKFFDRAIAFFEHLIQSEDRYDLATDLAIACLDKGVVLASLGEHRAAGALYDRAMTIHERLVEVEGRRELAEHLAKATMNKGVALRDLGDLVGSADLCERAVAIYERLVEVEGRRELANDLARAYVNHSVTLRAVGDQTSAAGFFDRSITIYQRLVEVEGRRELAGSLAKAKALRDGARVAIDPGQSKRVKIDKTKGLPDTTNVVKVHWK